MTEFLFAVGIVVFFISIYGAVMTGGHLLAELQARDVPDEPAPAQQRRLGDAAPRAAGTDGYDVDVSR